VTDLTRKQFVWHIQQ